MIIFIISNIRLIFLSLIQYRGGHSVTLIGSNMYVFGGYGGSGFARRDFNDVHVLDLDTWDWKPVECTGEHPEPRSGHQVRKEESKNIDT